MGPATTSHHYPLVAAGISLAILSGWGYFIWLLSHMGQ